MNDDRYRYSWLVPRLRTGPTLMSVPPRILRSIRRYEELSALFVATCSSVTSVPIVTARVTQLEQQQTEPNLHVDENGSLPPVDVAELQYLVSEIFHHLRVTADHLIYNVAWIDSGIEQQKTQFPVCKTEKEFQKRGMSQLNGVGSNHVSWIEKVQPYNGVTWTSNLAYLSNNDKHNYPLEVVPTLGFRVDLNGTRGATPDPTVVSLPVDQVEARIRLLRRDSETHNTLDEQFGGVVNGLTTLVNRFLAEAGISLIHLQLTPEVEPAGSS